MTTEEKLDRMQEMEGQMVAAEKEGNIELAMKLLFSIHELRLEINGGVKPSLELPF